MCISQLWPTFCPTRLLVFLICTLRRANVLKMTRFHMIGILARQLSESFVSVWLSSLSLLWCPCGSLGVIGETWWDGVVPCKELSPSVRSHQFILHRWGQPAQNWPLSQLTRQLSIQLSQNKTHTHATHTHTHTRANSCMATCKYMCAQSRSLARSQTHRHENTRVSHAHQCNTQRHMHAKEHWQVECQNSNDKAWAGHKCTLTLRLVMLWVVSNLSNWPRNAGAQRRVWCAGVGGRSCVMQCGRELNWHISCPLLEPCGGILTYTMSRDSLRWLLKLRCILLVVQKHVNDAEIAMYKNKMQ